ncbi:hypothetical protein HZH66_006007 [Vespula vulgaris]|uniref:Uncharacterized protein n=1 Tax=Vespula vulgaris TaxID=7454 RepID=A0A834K5X5_VESVU|nr:hypothetical protein HZH66_006007 [Vespula vulgaris]
MGGWLGWPVVAGIVGDTGIFYTRKFHGVSTFAWQLAGIHATRGTVQPEYWTVSMSLCVSAYDAELDARSHRNSERMAAPSNGDDTIAMARRARSCPADSTITTTLHYYYYTTTTIAAAAVGATAAATTTTYYYTLSTITYSGCNSNNQGNSSSSSGNSCSSVVVAAVVGGGVSDSHCKKSFESSPVPTMTRVKASKGSQSVRRDV